MVTVSVTDAHGNTDLIEHRYVVVYDPNGGFVTGAGWFDSPAGAFTADPDLTGRAKFGFTSQYRRGAHVPSGRTDFEFRAADFDFRSTHYDWLVIAGSKAKFKGVGTVNGAGEYGFMVTATDGDPDTLDQGLGRGHGSDGVRQPDRRGR